VATAGTTRDRHREDRTANLRRIAGGAGIALPDAYARRVVNDAGPRVDIGASRLGNGVVVHTVPPNKRSLPVLLGYADGRGQWYRDGTRHIEAPPEAAPAAREVVAL
jgi:hypothetical protein